MKFPKVPIKERPKPLYVAEIVPEEEEKVLSKLGWRIVDVRLMTNDSDSDRAEAVKCWLEGIRQGSIEADPKRLKFLELEAKIYGLYNTKQASVTKRSADEEEVDVLDILRDLRSDRAFKGTWDPTIAKG